MKLTITTAKTAGRKAARGLLYSAALAAAGAMVYGATLIGPKYREWQKARQDEQKVEQHHEYIEREIARLEKKFMIVRGYDFAFTAGDWSNVKKKEPEIVYPLRARLRNRYDFGKIARNKLLLNDYAEAAAMLENMSDLMDIQEIEPLRNSLNAGERLSGVMALFSSRNLSDHDGYKKTLEETQSALESARGLFAYRKDAEKEAEAKRLLHETALTALGEMIKHPSEYGEEIIGSMKALGKYNQQSKDSKARKAYENGLIALPAGVLSDGNGFGMLNAGMDTYTDIFSVSKAEENNFRARAMKKYCKYALYLNFAGVDDDDTKHFLRSCATDEGFVDNFAKNSGIRR